MDVRVTSWLQLLGLFGGIRTVSRAVVEVESGYCLRCIGCERMGRLTQHIVAEGSVVWNIEPLTRLWRGCF